MTLSGARPSRRVSPTHVSRALCSAQPWVFRVLEQLVIDEWDEINAKGLAKKFPPTPIAPPAKNPVGML